ncbi:hypothetical protein F5879DRAFT_976590 [Lentinula edodes]|nr:hypothetical protein F5879DRAFT_976590 [Lentinula edodes]
MIRNPQLSSQPTLQHYYDHFQIHKNPDWELRLTSNESLRYLLDCWDIRYESLNSAPPQITHFTPVPLQQQLSLETATDSFSSVPPGISPTHVAAVGYDEPDLLRNLAHTQQQHSILDHSLPLETKCSPSIEFHDSNNDKIEMIRLESADSFLQNELLSDPLTDFSEGSCTLLEESAAVPSLTPTKLSRNGHPTESECSQMECSPSFITLALCADDNKVVESTTPTQKATPASEKIPDPRTPLQYHIRLAAMDFSLLAISSNSISMPFLFIRWQHQYYEVLYNFGELLLCVWWIADCVQSSLKSRPSRSTLLSSTYTWVVTLAHFGYAPLHRMRFMLVLWVAFVMIIGVLVFSQQQQPRDGLMTY